MSQLYRTILSYCSVLLCLCLSLDSYAEGSKDLYPSGATGQRAYLMSTTNTSSLSWPYPTLGTHYAYVKPGETIAAASSAQGVGSGQIRLTAPNGTVYTTTVGTTTAGRIQNRTQELAGPFAGYTPYVRVAGSAEEGIWKIEFLPTISSSALAYDKATPNIDADDPWTQSDKDNTIAAWDVSVSSAGTAATIISGRVYATVMDMYVTSSGTYFGKLYVQTNDGYTYKVNNNGQAGAGFVFFVNNKGITNGNGDAAQPSYKSLNTSNAANVPIWDPRTADGAQSITHKMFYARPDAGLPTSASLPGGTSTWLKMPKIIPTVSSISIDGVEGTSGQVSSKGAYIKFNASQAGTFRITLSGSGGFATRIIRGSAVAGSNSVFWNGKDNDGNAPSTGTANITADIQLQGAEVHFPFFDVESNINGIIIEQLNDDGTVKSDIVYWDDSDASLNGTGAPSPRNNGNDGAGLHSNSNGHKWGTNYGNEKTMDTWAYVLGEVASQNTVLNIRRADLEVQPFNPAPVVTQVAAGQPITYKVAVVNNGPSDVEGAPFKFKVPAGFTIANLSDITVTTSCGIVNNALIDASGNYTALVDLPNGCIITFSITGRPGASLAGGPLSMEASIMRPNDVTDPDATNPDPAVPPTDPHVECENGTGTESCNNIKYNAAVTVTASADIVTVKSTGATNYVPGKSVDYTITVTNNGPSDAANVRVVDNAPGGGPSISSWTAVVTSGVVSLPATSGSGDLDQTISTLPNRAVITYTVTVDVPSNYNSDLTNTATVNSPTPDPNPGCTTCITPPISALPSADILTVKSTSATNYVPGNSVTYTITITNNGPSDAANVKVVDNAPGGGPSISSWTAAVTNGTVSLPATSGSGNLDQTIASLPNGAVVTYTVTVDVPSNYNSDLTNTATVTSPIPDPNPGCTTCTTPPISALPSADIVTVKSTGATNYVPGKSVDYTITVTNNGPSDAANVRVMDNAPGGGPSISSWTAVVTNGTVSLPATSGSGSLDQTIATLPNGAVVTYIVTVDVPSNYNSDLTNTATVTSPTPDPNPGCTTCTTPPISALPSADIVTVKSTGATNYVPGKSVDYTITVTNNGPSDAANVRVVDNAPGGGPSISSWTAVVTNGTVSLPATSGSGNLDQTISTLPNGAVVTYTVTVDVPSNYNSDLTNTATVTSPTPDPNPGCTTCITPPISALPSADIVTVKSTSATNYVPGNSVTYTITITNNGPSDAANVKVVDNAPGGGPSISSWTAAVTNGTVSLPATSGSGNLDQTISTLPNGAVVTYTVTVDVPSNYNSDLTNTATVTSPTPDPNPGCTTCTTPPISALPSADIVTVKNTSATNYVPGNSVTYTITITNNGPSDAANVKVVDNAPGGGPSISSWTAVVTNGTVSLPATSGSGSLDQTIATLPNGAVVTYIVTVDVPSNYNSDLTNTATVTSPTPDPNPGCTTCTTPPISALPSADIVTVKNTSATNYVPGNSVTYTVTITNNGPSDAANVNVVDNAPAGTAISSWSASVTTGTVTLPNTSGSGNINETIAALPNGAVVTYTITVAIPSNYNSNLTNTATVTSPTPDPVSGCTTCTTPPITAAPSADIVTTKTTSSTSYVPGGNVSYTITVTNNGPSDAANVNVVDNAPMGTTISSWTAAVTNGTVTLPNTSGTGNLNQTITTLPNGAVVTYTVTVAIPSGFTGTLSNTATVTSPTPDPTTGCTACTTPPISAAPSADIVTTKTTSATGYVPGGSVIYTITVRNNGPSNASNVNVVDNAPTGTTISSWTAAVTTGTVTLPNTSGTGNLNQTITTLPNGAVVTYTVTVAIPSGFTGNLSNTAAVTSPTPDPVPACTNCTTPPISAAPSADIVTTKTTSATGYVPGGSVIYTITVRNNGPSNASNVNVVDNAPTDTTISSWTAAVTNGTVTLPNTSGTGNLNQTITTLPNGAVVTYTVTVAIPSGFTGNLSNTATVTSPTPDPTPGCTACTTPPISAAPSADIVTTKTTSATGYVPGGSVTYTITVKNNGPSNASNVNVVDNAPTGTTISSWTAAVTNGTVTLPNTSGTGNLNQTITTLPNGAVVTYTVTVAIPSGFTGTLSNTATVTSPTPDPTPGCTACTTPPISAAPSADIVTTKTTSATGYVPGGTVTYTITVRNNGPSNASNVNVVDNAPAGTTISNWTAAVTNGTVTLPNTSGTGNLNQTITTLPNGAVVTYTVTVAIPSGFTGNLSNTAAVTSPTPDPTPGCAACTTTPISAAPSADIVTVKTTQTAGQTTFTPGENVIYTITVTNNGPSDAATVNIKDIAPTGTTIGAWTASVTKGSVTLPNTSGTGNLDETIATLPNGAVVTYTVTIQTPATFTGTLSNTATVTSATPDPVPACAACTTAPLTGVTVATAPVADNDALEGKADNTLTIPVLNNDKPGTGANPSPIDPTTLEIVEQPKHGTVKISEDGTLTYTPDRGYYGQETFTYRVQDEAGNWSNVATVTLSIVPNELDIPNVITPNGDGANDRFVIKGLEKYTQHEIIIFNRWNNMLFRSKNYQGDWEGKGLNAGTYYYTLKVQESNGQWHTYNGYIMLMR